MIALGSLSFLDHFLLWLEMFGSDNGVDAQWNIWTLIIKFLNTISWLSTEAMILRMKSFQDEIKSHSADGTWEWPKCKRFHPAIMPIVDCCVYSTDAAVQGLTALWLIHILGGWLKIIDRKIENSVQGLTALRAESSIFVLARPVDQTWHLWSNSWCGTQNKTKRT